MPILCKRHVQFRVKETGFFHLLDDGILLIHSFGICGSILDVGREPAIDRVVPDDGVGIVAHYRSR